MNPLEKAITVVLSNVDLNRLRGHAADLGMRHTAVAALIVQAWLRRPTKAVLRKRTLDEIQASPAVRAIVDLRTKIIRGWIEERKKRRGRSIRLAATLYAAQAARRHRIGLSVSTLYNWHRAYFKHGMAGLIDRRLADIRGFDVPGTLRAARKRDIAGG